MTLLRSLRGRLSGSRDPVPSSQFSVLSSQFSVFGFPPLDFCRRPPACSGGRMVALFGGFHNPVTGHALDFFSYFVQVYFLGCFFLGWLRGCGWSVGFVLAGSGLLVDGGEWWWLECCEE